MPRLLGAKKSNGATNSEEQHFKFNPRDDGTVEHNGLLLPADMSDELKILNVHIENKTDEVLSEKE
jgi:hypothetical protein